MLVVACWEEVESIAFINKVTVQERRRKEEVESSLDHLIPLHHLASLNFSLNLSSALQDEDKRKRAAAV